MGVLKIKTNENTWEAIDDLTLTNLISVNNSDGTKNVKIQNGELLIDGENLANYLSENTSACKVGDASEPTEIGKTGDLYVQITGGYSLLWYFNGSEWVRMNSIWG